MKTLIYDAPPQSTLTLPDTGTEVTGGQTFVVDDTAAEELLTNPHLRYGVKEADVDPSRMTRSELDEFAARHGVQNPGSYSSKTALLEALESHPGSPDNPIVVETQDEDDDDQEPDSSD